MAVILIPFRIIGWLFKHPRMLVVIALGVGIIFAVRTCACSNTSASQEKYQQTEPSRIDAPYVLPTLTRVYYVKSYTQTDSTYLLQEYYTYDSKKWKLQKTTIPVPRYQFGKEVKMYVRQD